MHELASENLRRVVPGIENSGWCHLVTVMASETMRVCLEARVLHNGKRELVLVISCFEMNGRMVTQHHRKLGAISTVAELREWYQRLGGKGWE